jgi:predicted flap endonuclease-1-like 5' DNA nuclease
MAFFVPFVLGVVIGRVLKWPDLWRGERESPPSSPRQLLPGLTPDVAPEQETASVEPPMARRTGEGPVRQQSLEQVRGIGPIYATRLRESGVGTFADLAQLTPERIVEIVLRDREASESLIDAEDWKRQARILAEEHENEPRG